MKIHHLLATLILAAAPAIAGPGEGHGHGQAKSHAEVQIPATLPELWAGIQKEQAALVSALEKKDGMAGHNIAETLIAYANALPTKAEGLDAAKLERITGQTKNLARVYGDIHHAAEDAAFDKALKDAAKAASVLKLLEPQLPLGN
jgi:hypothetical protein